MKLTSLMMGLLFALPAGAASAADVELWRLDCGTIAVKDMAAFSDTFDYSGKQRTLTDSCYLIRHAAAYMLWDTGLPEGLLKAPLDKNAAMSPTLDKTITTQLAEIGVKPEQVSVVGISHNHFDHVGQAASFPQATLMIGRADLEDFSANPPHFGVDPKLVAPWIGGGSKAEPVDGDKDVFGDGSVVILDTPGHTHGSKSLLVKLEAAGPVLLSGDTVHFEEQFANHGVPPFNADRAESLASMDRLEHIAKTLKATLVVQHDANDIAKLPAFPASAK